MLRSSLAALPSEHGSLSLHSNLAPRFIVWKKFWVFKYYGKSSSTRLVVYIYYCYDPSLSSWILNDVTGSSPEELPEENTSVGCQFTNVI